MNFFVDFLLDLLICLIIYIEEKLCLYICSFEVIDELFLCVVDSVVNCYMKIFSLFF